MNNGKKSKFDIKINEHPNGWWSFGICLSHEEYSPHQENETYLYINFFKWSISIGFMHEEEDWEDWIDNYLR